MESCDVCKIEFPHSDPNLCIGEGQLRGGNGVWVFVCEGHKGRVVRLEKID